MKSLEDRFWAKVEKTDTCWNWNGPKNHKGYGVHAGGAAHRLAYKAAHGSIDPNLLVDHKCRNRGCVRPDHLRLVTPGQNTENQNGHSDSRSGRRGVAFHTKSGKWLAKATKNGKTHSGGLFTDVDEAAEAARQLRLKLHTHNDLDRAA